MRDNVQKNGFRLRHDYQAAQANRANPAQELTSWPQVRTRGGAAMIQRLLMLLTLTALAACLDQPFGTTIPGEDSAVPAPEVKDHDTGKAGNVIRYPPLARIISV